MTDTKLAAQVAFLQALKAAEAVTSRSTVYQHVPEKAQPPMTIVGDIEATPEGGKDGGLDRLQVDVITIVRAPSRARLYALMSATRAAVEDQALPAQPGMALSRPVLEAESDDLGEDGQTYVGAQRFSLWAQATHGPDLLSAPVPIALAGAAVIHTEDVAVTAGRTYDLSVAGSWTDGRIVAGLGTAGAGATIEGGLDGADTMEIVALETGTVAFTLTDAQQDAAGSLTILELRERL